MSDPEYIARLLRLVNLTIHRCRNAGAVFSLALAPETDDKSVAAANSSKQPFANLTQLSLYSCTWHELDGINILIGLESLTLCNVHIQAQPQGVNMSILSPLSKLTRLSLSEHSNLRIMPITDHTMSSLCHLEHLKHLLLNGCSITDAGLAKLSSISTLKHLSVFNCEHVTGEGLCAPSNVSHLTLNNIPITTKTFVAIGKLQSVICLRLNKNTLPPADAVEALMPLKLIHIDLTECKGVSLEFIFAVIRTFPHLGISNIELDKNILDKLKILGF
jgi:hypothetical protein